ncbi:hypothetical protein ES288_D04G214200v1 [Gossypium darwinii]|uniref:Uncharacterized protein n=1 Tax=Gossypium darwinii TaxID=34276 RepID=A0A5D2D2U0_GOSDA|nr:hypothetical protein ES288_D04G214200v1 [Gossypium darwinii]
MHPRKPNSLGPKTNRKGPPNPPFKADLDDGEPPTMRPTVFQVSDEANGGGRGMREETKWRAAGAWACGACGAWRLGG